MMRPWVWVFAVALTGQAGCADASKGSSSSQAVPAESNTTSAEVALGSAATGSSVATANVASKASATETSEVAAVLSAQKPPRAPDARAQQLTKELAELDVQLLEALSSAGTPRDYLLPSGGMPPSLLEKAASGPRGGTGDLQVGTGAGGSLRGKTGELRPATGGGSVGLGSGAKLSSKIAGKTAKELTVADLDKALVAAGCTTTRLDSPSSPSAGPAVAIIEAQCSDQTFNITFAPVGATQPDAKTFAEMEKNGATWKEDGMLLAILPKQKDGRPAALELMKKLRADSSGVKGNAAVGGAAVSGGSVANASSVVAGMAAGFRRCYNKGLQEDPNMKGTVKITAKIGVNGEVLSSSPSGGDGLSTTVTSCVAARVASAMFSPPDGGSATIVIPVSFFPAQ